MKAITPPVVHENAVHVVMGARQPQYEPLPAAVDPSGLVMTEWELSAEELAAILAGGRIRLWISTFNNPMQPVALEVVTAEGCQVERT